MKVGKYKDGPHHSVTDFNFSLDFNLLFKTNNNLSCFNTLSCRKHLSLLIFLELSTVMPTSGISKHLLSWIEEEAS